MKMELKHLAPYLPYGLKCRLSHEGIFNLDSEYPNEHQGKIGTLTSFGFCNDEINGTFHVTDNYSFDFDQQSEIEILLRPLSSLTKEIEHNGETNQMWLLIPIGYTVDNIQEWPYKYIESLFQWHFDVFGLIEKGLAISIESPELLEAVSND